MAMAPLAKAASVMAPVTTILRMALNPPSS
jgi:hypothetical protein